MANTNLSNAQNFELFGLKKLISTSYAIESKNAANGAVGSAPRADRELYYQPSLFETESPQFDRKKTRVRGKIFVLDHDTNRNGRIDIDDLEWDYLNGDGDFRSDEVKALRDEADVIVTNPPFSLFREFLAWIVGDGGDAYSHYTNYDAIEVPFTDAIPSDYDGVMGVPITFLDKYCPDQFEILGMCENEDAYGLKTRVYTSAECKAAYQAKFGKPGTYDLNRSGVLNVNGVLEQTYHRIFIRRRGNGTAQV